jgi:hypothetical protein
MPNLPWTKRRICQLSIIGAASGSQFVTTHHFEAEATFDTALNISDEAAQAAGTDLANAWITAVKPEYLACCGNNYGMLTVRAQILERNGQFRHRLVPTEVASTGAGTASSGQPGPDLEAAMCIRWRSVQAGKRHRGRSYLGPVPPAMISGGVLNTLHLAAGMAYVTAMLAEWGPSGTAPLNWRLTVYSRPYNNGEYGYPTGSHPNKMFHYPEDYAGNSTWVTSGSPDSVLRSQRRRQVGVGA